MVNRLRVAFFGTPEFAVPTLDALLRSRHQVVAVVTQPDRPRGRGQHATDAPVKARAVASGLTILQPDRLKDPSFADAFAALNADLGVVAAYGKILPESLIDTPRFGMINVHASLLPKYRGAAPIHRAVIAGDAETGVTIMRVVKALDAGPMIATVTRAIGPNDTSDEVEHDLAMLGAALLVDVVDRMADDVVTERPQDDAQATYASRLAKDEGLIDWALPATQIHNRIRGLRPWPQTWTFLDGRRVIVQKSTLDDGSVSAEPGVIVEAGGDAFVAATGHGRLRLLQLQPEGRRSVSAREFLAGHPVHAGARFSSAP